MNVRRAVNTGLAIALGRIPSSTMDEIRLAQHVRERVSPPLPPPAPEENERQRAARAKRARKQFVRAVLGANQSGEVK